jgi:hypothetical protein
MIFIFLDLNLWLSDKSLDTNEAFAYNKHLPSLVAQSAERAAVNR